MILAWEQDESARSRLLADESIEGSVTGVPGPAALMNFHLSSSCCSRST